MSSEMLKQLPPFMRKSKVYKEIFKAEEKRFTSVDTILDDIRAQLSIDTATWALNIYEKELGIRTDKSKTLNERRSLVKSKWRGAGKVDRKLIELVASVYANGSVYVMYGSQPYSYDTYRTANATPPYPIVIKFIDTRGIPSNIEDLKAVIEEIKPAHLEVQYQFRYLTWSELDAKNLTWDQLDAMNLTWDDFESGSWL